MNEEEGCLDLARADEGEGPIDFISWRQRMGSLASWLRRRFNAYLQGCVFGDSAEIEDLVGLETSLGGHC
jgi:hypothetical protein